VTDHDDIHLTEPDIRAAVFARDSYTCVLRPRASLRGLAYAGAGRCYGNPTTAHHLRKASKGGLYVIYNLVTLCSYHNDWVEDYPLVAHTWGLVIRTGETYQEAWARMHLASLVDYWWDGSPAIGPWPGQP
jgi:hypothetical protein